MTTEYRVSVESNDLRRAINIVKRMGTGADGPAFIRVAANQMTIDWWGTAASTTCESSAPFAVRLPGVAMRNMVRAGKQLTGPIEIVCLGKKLDFGTFSVPCEQVDDDRAKSLPVGAGDFEVLSIDLTESDEAVAQKGLGDATARVDDRLERSVEHAFTALKWLHIDRDLVRSWVESHVRARAGGVVSFEIVSDSTQRSGNGTQE